MVGNDWGLLAASARWCARRQTTWEAQPLVRAALVIKYGVLAPVSSGPHTISGRPAAVTGTQAAMHLKHLLLIATGSEVGLAVQAADRLTAAGRRVRVVSMPCTSVFDAQDAEYKQRVLPVEVSARIAIEAAHSDFWYKYVGLEGRII